MYYQYNAKVHTYRHRAFRFNLFAAAALFPRCFFLSTDTDVGGSKQKRVLLSKTCSQKPHDFTIVHGWTWFHTVTSLTFRQTRVQALYMDVQRLIEDFRFNRCPEYFLPYSCLLLTYSRNSFCEKENAVLYLLIGV